jgi:hypothetical protein
VRRGRRINARLCHSASIGCEALYDAGNLGASILELREVELPKARRIRKDGRSGSRRLSARLTIGSGTRIPAGSSRRDCRDRNMFRLTRVLPQPCPLAKARPVTFRRGTGSYQ